MTKKKEDLTMTVGELDGFKGTESKKVRSLFILFFPSLLIAVVPSEVNGNIWWPLVFKGLLLFFQFVLLKNFIDTQYD